MYMGDRIMLRRLLPDDGALWERWLSDPELNAIMSTGMGSPISPVMLREAAERLAEDSTTRIDFTILTLEGVPIGSVHLADIDPWARRAELGIFIGEPGYRGCGLGTEATRLLLTFAFQQLNLHKVWLTVDADNTPGLRCYDKLGFHHDGILRHEVFKNGRYVDRVLMSILDDEFHSLWAGSTTGERAAKASDTA